MPRQRIAALHDARRVEHARECTLGCVRLEEVNALGRGEFVARLGAVFEHSPWVAERAWRAHPFSSVDELHQAMMSAVGQASDEEQLALVRAHPELAGAQAIDRRLTKNSSREQARLGLNSLSSAEFRSMSELNGRYREKFGFPCIIALRLHESRASVMTEMARRLENEPAKELPNALEQIGHIVRGRLANLFGEE